MQETCINTCIQLLVMEYVRMSIFDMIYTYIYIYIYTHTHTHTCGAGSSVGIANDYGLDGPGIKSQWEKDYLHMSRPVLGHTQPPVQWVPGISRR
jgi:hypothetical protein